MNSWVSQSSPGKQLMLSAGCAIVGLILLVGLRRSGQSPNATAGIWLGVLLLIIGVAGALMSAAQTVTVDPRQRRIVVEDRYLIGAKKHSISFSDIESVGIGYLGKRSNGVTIYYLVLHLRSGQLYHLFAPGRFYTGSADRTIVEGWQRRIEAYIAPAQPHRTADDLRARG
jgi:hypothetical protein